VNWRWLSAGVAAVAILAVAGYLYTTRTVRDDGIDLVERFPEAEKRTTMSSLHEAFAVVEAQVDGDARRSIIALPFSRIIWTVDVPEHAVLETAAGIRQGEWTVPSDGAIFRVGVSAKGTYTEFFKQTINPYHKQEDRRWVPIRVDLGKYAGQRAEVIFNTEPGFNAVGDAALWVAPRIVIRPPPT
jgi:hypothetical protein